ncbi:hypothetical protein ACCQ07_22180 (plasmid) [Xanthomonas sp. NCPPB 3583]|uniref:hypothetical protein n=1 Tax=Xanthomonas sp. NCPPB 3583 TaxID=487558 RepID=UPI0035574C36
MNENALVVSAVEHGESSRFERLDAPRPGTYWRLLQDVTGDEDGKQIESNPLDAGTVLLLESIEYADGEPHVYKFAAHPGVPEDEADSSLFHADCFWRYWTYCPEAAQVRERELLALHHEMAQTQARLLQPPPAAKPIASLGYDPSAPTQAEGQALATPGQLRDMTVYAERLKENAEATQKWIAKHSEALTGQGEALARFHMERATVGLAAAQGQLDAVRGILRTVENLKIYTGDGVEVTQLRQGAPAPVELPLTIYQELLSLDEELLLHLEVNGLDHRDLDSVAAVMADDALLARLVPAARGMVLCRFRGSYKEFVKPSRPGDIGAAMANQQLNQISQLHMLLVRDGEQVYLVEGPEFLQKIKQLMPNAAEQIGHFSDRDGQAIRRDDLAYAKAQRSQLGSLDAYAKVLTMLWGLRDRDVFFADWAVPTFASWLDWGFQERYLRLVDQSMMLGVTRPSYDAYREEQNRYLAAGAWVAVRVSALFEQRFIPGAFASQETRQYGNHWGYTRVYALKHRTPIIANVRRDKRGDYIEVPLVHEWKSAGREIMGRLYLQREAMQEVLVLDRVHAGDLTYYLTSRAQRRNYNDYIQLFQAARTWVAERDATEEPLRAELREAVTAARILHDADALEGAITAALAVARTARRDKCSPAPESSSYASYRKGALDTLHALLTDQAGRTAAVDVWCQRHGRRPLRLVSTGKGEFKVYLEPVASEHQALLGAPRHATSATVTFDPQTGEAVLEGWQRELLRAAASEHVIHDWQYITKIAGDPEATSYLERRDRAIDDGAARWLAHKSLLGTLRYDQAEALLQLPVQQSDSFRRGLDMARMASQAISSKSNKIVRHRLRFAIGIVHERGRPYMLMAEHDTLAYCYANANAAGKQACVDLIRAWYKTPEPAVQRLLQGEVDWTPCYVDLSAVWTYRDQARCDDLDYRGTVFEGNVLDPGLSEKENSGRDISCMGLTALGAELFPWLASRTRQAM